MCASFSCLFVARASNRFQNNFLRNQRQLKEEFRDRSIPVFNVSLSVSGLVAEHSASKLDALHTLGEDGEVA
jgi:hypothetical protein